MYTVYKATHLPTGKVYIGKTSQGLEVRKTQHYKTPERRQQKFQKLLISTPVAEWVWEVLHVISNSCQATDCELYYINTLNTYENGLNTGSGKTQSPEVRRAASERFKAYRAENPTTWHKGRTGVYSEETLEKMRLAKLKNPTRLVYTDEMKMRKSLATENRKEIQELKSGLKFQSISAAAKHFNLRREGVRDVVNGKRSHVAGLVFTEVKKDAQ